MEDIPAVGIAIFALSGCTNVDITDHISAPGYDRTVKRVFVAMSTDLAFGGYFDRDFSKVFRASLSSEFLSCQVETLVYQFDNMELNGQAKLQSALTMFMPDTILSVGHPVTYIGNGGAEKYVFTMYDTVQKRDVWKASIGVSATSDLYTDRAHMGVDLAGEIIGQMVADHVIKTCPPSPKKK